MTKLILGCIPVVVGFAWWLWRRYGSRQASADKLWKKIRQREAELEYITQQFVQATLEGADINKRRKLHSKRAQLLTELSNLRAEYRRYNGHSTSKE